MTGKTVDDSVAPNQTLYVSNLPDKLQKLDLRRHLYFLFTGYGPVLDVVALKTTKMRGQAFIAFRDIDSATQAMRSLQGFEFFGKEMDIKYAKSKSDSIAKLDGSFKMPFSGDEAEAKRDRAAGERSALQESIFAPPGSVAPNQNGTAEAKGTKRPRDEDEDEGGEAPMEEDDGEEMDMDESD